MRKTLILLLVVLLGQALGQAQTFEAAAGSAKADLDKCLILEPQNGEARTLLKGITAKLETVMFENLKATSRTTH